jgi:hypothetical protein
MRGAARPAPRVDAAVGSFAAGLAVPLRVVDAVGSFAAGLAVPLRVVDAVGSSAAALAVAMRVPAARAAGSGRAVSGGPSRRRAAPASGPR